MPSKKGGAAGGGKQGQSNVSSKANVPKIGAADQTAAKDRGPLLITIAPMCAGKTTFLAGLGEAVQDIAIDNAPQVYEKVPVTTAVHLLEPTSEAKPAPYTDKKAYGKSVVQRILEQKESEQMILISLFSGAISLESAEQRLLEAKATPEFLTAVRTHKSDGAVMTSPTLDLYIPDAVGFGVQQYLTQLESAAKNTNGCFASGNTNIQQKDYAQALAIAAVNKRRVRFVRWGVELPKVPLAELFARSISRLLRTGRYVPSFRIALAVRQADDIMLPDSSHSALAAAAGFAMSSDGYVRASGGEDPPTETAAISADSKWKLWFAEGEERVFNLRDVHP